MEYQFTAGSEIIRKSDGACIPEDPANRDYQAYLSWVAAGNKADPAPDEAWPAYQQSALSALGDSDITVLRCFEGGIALPAEWATYRKALRAIVSATTGDASKSLPTRPAYPPGS